MNGHCVRTNCRETSPTKFSKLTLKAFQSKMGHKSGQAKSKGPHIDLSVNPEVKSQDFKLGIKTHEFLNTEWLLPMEGLELTDHLKQKQFQSCSFGKAKLFFFFLQGALQSIFALLSFPHNEPVHWEGVATRLVICRNSPISSDCSFPGSN